MFPFNVLSTHSVPDVGGDVGVSVGSNVGVIVGVKDGNALGDELGTSVTHVPQFALQVWKTNSVAQLAVAHVK